MEAKSTGTIIYENRKKKSFTQKTLADKLNVTDKDVSNWERDIARPDLRTIPKLAEVLDIPTALLTSIPTNSKTVFMPEHDEHNNHSANMMESLDESVLDVKYAIYKENVKHLLKQGLAGFSAGFIFVLLTSFLDQEPLNLMMALAVGLYFSGIPYGWGLLTKVIGHWIVIGSIPIMIIVFCCKFACAILISWVAYPIALLYNLIRSQRNGSKLQVVFIILLALFLSLIAAIFIF